MLKAVARKLAPVVLALAAGHAQAYVFSIDSFVITRNGVPFFTDNFGNGVPPPNAPNFAGGGPASYQTVGTLGPENAGANGRLILDQTGAVIVPNAVGSGSAFQQSATLNTNIDSTNTTNGLKRNHSFAVTGLFDLIPAAPNDRYGIRVTDQNSAQRDDQLDLRITNVGGLQFIEFRDANPTTDAFISSFLPLDTTHDQIALILDHAVADTDTVFARFQYFDGGVASSAVTTFAQTANIFSGELFTQGRFGALQGIGPTAVPEPSTIALMLGGLGFVGAAVRRRRSSGAS
jgi:hypothetical protein